MLEIQRAIYTKFPINKSVDFESGFCCKIMSSCSKSGRAQRIEIISNQRAVREEIDIYLGVVVEGCLLVEFWFLGWGMKESPVWGNCCCWLGLVLLELLALPMPPFPCFKPPETKDRWLVLLAAHRYFILRKIEGNEKKLLFTEMDLFINNNFE